MVAGITIEDIREAAGSIRPSVRCTPLERARWLSNEAGRDVWLKLECFQTTGSFKIRGAMSRLAALDGEEKSRGVLAVSAGNHGLAVAHCATELGIDAAIIVPRSASRAKVEAIRRYPVSLIEAGASYDEAERAARKMERETDRVFVSPYNDPHVISGQGTVALEVLEDSPEIDCLLVPVGGGGLIAGMAIAAKAIKPGIKIYGIEPAASPTMTRSLERGIIVEIEEDETIADGLAGNIEPGSITFPIIQSLVDRMILVSEDSIRRCLARVAREEHLMIEGSAAVSLAALEDAHLQESRVAAIITGRNIALDLFARIIRDEQRP